MKERRFLTGVKDGLPIGLGYLSVSFTFGLMVVSQGLSALTAVIISMTNVTSAGQVAGLAVIASMGTLAEMAIAQAVINMRYALMSISLSQKLDGDMTTLHRMAIAFMMTDEVFAVASSKQGLLKRTYLYGLILLPFLGWTLGTLMGAVAGGLLPEGLKAAMGIAIYGMFIAIVVPPARADRGVLFTAVCAVALSLCMAYVPGLSTVSDGIALVICGVAAAGLAALLFPRKEEQA